MKTADAVSALREEPHLCGATVDPIGFAAVFGRERGRFADAILDEGESFEGVFNLRKLCHKLVLVLARVWFHGGLECIDRWGFAC